MYRNVLIATDGSELAQKAVDHGIAMAQAINAKITVVTVSEPFHAFAVQPRMVTDMREQYEQHVAACAAECLAAAKKAASAASVACDTVHVEYPPPYQGIIDTATQKVCDLIVMASARDIAFSRRLIFGAFRRRVSLLRHPPPCEVALSHARDPNDAATVGF